VGRRQYRQTRRRLCKLRSEWHLSERLPGCLREGQQVSGLNLLQPGAQGPKARCWLKASVPPPHPNTCCISEMMDHTDLGVH